ncbi:MAG: hypothetical protein ACTSYD_01435 [Candidatus Heimdallarchaeaceae archaeon]
MGFRKVCTRLDEEKIKELPPELQERVRPGQEICMAMSQDPLDRRILGAVVLDSSNRKDIVDGSPIVEMEDSFGDEKIVKELLKFYKEEYFPKKKH